MSKKACKCKEVECEECPEWIFTLADLIMCMMGLFVILWVLKPGIAASEKSESNDKWLDAIAKIREAFDYLPDPQSNDPVDIRMIMQKLQQMKPLKGPGDGGKTRLERKGAEGDQAETQVIRVGPQSTVGSRVLFDVGSTELTPESKKILDQIVQLIKGHRNVMFVKGHTSFDDFPEGTDAQQQFDLSMRRAKVVMNYLVEHGVEPATLRPLACSIYEAVSERAYTAEARQNNRRVEVESTTTLVPELQDKPAKAKPTEPGAEDPDTKRPPAPAGSP
jgi:outer membrane protein OmpA-like peptidoglycan-associated protein